MRLLVFNNRISVLQEVASQNHTGEYDGNGGAQLDEDVQGRTGGILEGIAHSVAHHSGLMLLRTLTAVIAPFNILLGIVPGTACIGHGDSQ